MPANSAIPPPPHIGVIVKQSRKELHLTLEQLAERCSVSKSMLSQIERGQVNPTFSVVWNLTQALGLNLNLLGESAITDDVIEHTHGYSTPTIKSADGLCTLRLLSPARTVLSVEWYEITMQPGGCLDSAPHARGTYEHFSCFDGIIQVTSGNHVATANCGDTLRYNADRPHKICNVGEQVATGLLVVGLPSQYDSKSA